MKRYTINVDGLYFAGETMEPVEGHAIAPSGFFQNVRENGMTAYAYTPDRIKASVIDLFSATGYLKGIYERTRYLSDGEKPKCITLDEVVCDIAQVCEGCEECGFCDKEKEARDDKG
jgi:hypothetical protein